MEERDCSIREIVKINSFAVKRLKANKTKKVVVYGLNEHIKSLLLLMLDYNIYVDGVIVDKNDYTYCKMKSQKYLEKRVYSMEEVKRATDLIVIDVYGNNMKYLKCSSSNEVLQFYKKKANTKNVVIYGAGLWGRDSADIIKGLGYRIEKYCDSDYEKVGTFCNGVEIISIKTLLEEYANSYVIICIKNKQTALEVEAILKRNKFEGHCSIFSDFYFQDKLCVISKDKTISYSFAGLAMLWRESQKKELAYMGTEPALSELARKLALLDISVKYKIDIEKSQILDVEEKSIDYESFEEKVSLDKVFIGVFPEAKSLALSLKKECENSVFFYGDGIISIGYEQILDANLGYMKKFETTKVEKKKEVVLVVLGNSTSEELYIVKTWVDFLKEIASDMGICLTIYNYAVSAYGVAQELLLLERDIIHMKPDIVISYSGSNERSCLHSKENYFTSAVQKEMCDYAKQNDFFHNRHIKTEVYHGKQSADEGRHWLNIERMMSAVCNEFCIRFFAFLQPTLITQKEKSVIEEMLLFFFESVVNELYTSVGNIKQALQEGESYPWLYDLTDIFDNIQEEVYLDVVHLTEEGNKIIAKKIFEIIKDDLLDMENRLR